MKKTYTVLAAMALVGSAQAATTDIIPSVGATPIAVCAGSVAEKFNVAGGPGVPYTEADSFIKVGFSVQCSSNSHVAFANVSGTQFLVGSGSAKGNQSFKGSSNGGAVVTHTVCTGTNQACGATDAAAATTAASSL